VERIWKKSGGKNCKSAKFFKIPAQDAKGLERAKNFKESDVLARISSLDITCGPCAACDNEAMAMDIADKSPESA